MAFSVAIPAQFHSNRVPRKPLLDLCGLSMLQRMYQQACKSDASQVYLATDHVDTCEDLIHMHAFLASMALES